MFEIVGKYNKATIYTDMPVEDEAYGQVLSFMNHHAFSKGRAAWMPDIHGGAGVPIGFTFELKTDKIIPNVVGVDGSCGVLAICLGKIDDLNDDFFQRLDDFIRKNIPSGHDVRKSVASLKLIDRMVRSHRYTVKSFMDEMLHISNITKQNQSYVECSLGTLGGGK